jgi:hypothetical protein
MDNNSTYVRKSRLVFIFVLGVLLLLPSMWVGFLFDDYIYKIILDGKTLAGDSPGSLFAFVPGDPEGSAAVAEKGFLPWWYYEELKIVFWRPLSEILARFDHAVFGENAFAYHAHSMLWWLGMLFSAAIVLRKVLPGTIGTLALLIFALDESHVLPVAWLANRNALVALLPAFVGLWGHLKWREDNWRPGRALSITGFGIGLTGGETALCVLAYLFAYEVWGTTSPLRQRVRAVAPLAVVFTAYIVANRLGGGGVSGCGVYFDPVMDPLGYLTQLPGRFFTLLAGGILGFSANFWILVPAIRPILIAVGCAGVLLLLVLLRSAWPRLDLKSRNGLRWLLPGSALALLPVAASFPSDRLLLGAGFGLSAGMAAVFIHAWKSWRGRSRRLVIAAGAFLAGVHLLLVPLARLYHQYAVITLSRSSVELAHSVETSLSSDENTDFVVLTAPDHIVGIYLSVLLLHFDHLPFDSWRTLSVAPYDHRIIGGAPRSFTLEVIDGTMMGNLFECLYRDSNHPLRVGDTFNRGLLRAEILDVSHTGPTRVAFHFDRELTDTSLRFLAWEEGELRPVMIPAAGDTLYLPRTLGPAGF